MPTISNPQLGEIAYRTSGEGQTALVFMHGWAGSGAYFDSTLEHLDPSLVYCVTLDFAGHGRSAEPPAPCSLDQLADTVTAVADAAGADTFIILGFSMSGKFAQYVTSRHPDRVLGQVLVAGCPAGPLALPPELVDDWCSRAGNADRLLDIVRDCSTRPIPPHVMEAAGCDAARVSERVLRETIDLVATASFSPQVVGSQVPTLVVGGLRDWLFPPDVMRDGVAGPLARVRLELLDCGHEIPIELPHELAQIVTQFVPECTHSPTVTEVPPSRRR
jgi:pimeloyl-ACP methyl ester carboxylesterase